MSRVQRLVKKLLPEKMADEVEAESRLWRLLCACGHNRSFWDIGGIRYKAVGNPRKLTRLPLLVR